MSLRTRLAREIGITLGDMHGFSERHGFDGIPWDKVKDGIVPLLNHTDCEGELSVEEMKSVAPRLRELVAAWPDFDYDKQTSLALSAHMEKLILENTPLVFC